MQTLLRLGLTIAGWLPLPLLHGIGWLLGNLLWLLPNHHRAISLLHLERCLPALDPAQRGRIARSSLIESVKALVEAPAFWFGPVWRLRRWIDDEPARAILREAHAAGHGVIMLTLHLGAWEIASFFCSQVAPITVTYKPQKGVADAVIRAGRGRWPGLRPVPTSTQGVKVLLSALKRNELIGTLPDHDPPVSSGTVFAPFFGIAANTMELVTKLAGRSGAVVLFIVAERLSWGRGFRFHLQRAPDEIADAKNGPAAMNAGVEVLVRRWPGQYWWSYKRFRRRPPGEADFYGGL